MIESFIGIALYLVIYSKIKNKYKYYELIFIIIFVSALSGIAYFANPPRSWDLYRHFQWLNQIEYSNISLFDFLFNNTLGVGNRNYSHLFFFNIIRWFVAKTGDYNLLPVIAIQIDYYIISFIIIDWSKNTSTKVNMLSLFICFASLPYAFALSGIRNGVAACIEALAVYLYLFKNKKMYVYLFISLIAFTFHYIVLIVLPIAFLAKYKFKIKILLVILLSSIFFNVIANIFLESNYDFLKFIGGAYLLYSSDSQYIADDYPLYSVIYISIFTIILFLTSNIRKNGVFQNNIYTFCVYYCAYIAANFGNYDLVLRPAYLLGGLSPVIASMFLKYKGDKYNRLFPAVVIALAFLVTGYVDFRYFLSTLGAY